MKTLPGFIFVILLLLIVVPAVTMAYMSPPWPSQEALDSAQRAAIDIERKRSEAQIEQDKATHDTLMFILQVGGIGLAVGVAIAGVGAGVSLVGKGLQWASYSKVSPNRNGQLPMIVRRAAGDLAISDPNRSLTGLTVIEGPTLAREIRAAVRSEMLQISARQIGERDSHQLAVATQAAAVSNTVATMANITRAQPKSQAAPQSATSDAWTITNPESQVPLLPPITINDETGSHLLEAPHDTTQ